MYGYSTVVCTCTVCWSVPAEAVTVNVYVFGEGEVDVDTPGLEPHPFMESNTAARVIIVTS